MRKYRSTETLPVITRCGRDVEHPASRREACSLCSRRCRMVTAANRISAPVRSRTRIALVVLPDWCAAPIVNATPSVARKLRNVNPATHKDSRPVVLAPTVQLRLAPRVGLASTRAAPAGIVASQTVRVVAPRRNSSQSASRCRAGTEALRCGSSGWR